MTRFSTTAEVLDRLRTVREAVERLPFDSTQEAERANGFLGAAEAGLRSLLLCDPAKAAGTHRYRQLHGLSPIAEEESNGPE